MNRKNATMIVILSAHLDRYPLMQPQDVVKLLFQSEFGPGHLITDRDSCLRYLEEEYRSTRHDPDMPLTEEIGGGFVRVNLAALDTETLPLEEFLEMFMNSANHHEGDKERFLETLGQVKGCYKDLPFSFSYEELSDYLDGYAAKGCPAVHHSEIYRRTYHPAYRVVKDIR